MRSGQAHSGRTDLNQNRGYLRIPDRGFESIANIKERRGAPAAQLLQWRSWNIFANSAGQPDCQNRFAWNPGWPNHQEIESHPDTRGEQQRHNSYPSPTCTKTNHAERYENGDHKRDTD